MKLLRPILPAALLIGLSGCYMEVYSDPIPIPASYTPKSYSPAVTQREIAPAPSTTAPAPQPTPAAIDDKTRDQITAAARDQILKRFTVDKNPALNEYLTLVGSLLTITTAHPNSEYEYVLLATDKPLSVAIWPKTICISKGLLKQMEDESELAGVIAREISNLASARYLKAADLPTPAPSLSPSTRPTTQPSNAAVTAAQSALIQKHASELVDLLLKSNPGTDSVGFASANVSSEINQAADLEGARLAAAAKYAPDGYLKLLTRQTAPNTTNSKADWDRIKSLNANVEIITKAFPHAEVKLPARFESYVKTPKVETTGTH